MSAHGLSEEDNYSNSLFRSAPGGQRLRWRPWPCPKCSSGLTPIGVIIRGIDAGSIVLGDEPEKLSADQSSLLIDWASKCPHEFEQQISLPKIAEGSEHAVFLDAPNIRVYKTTLPHTFGESYYLEDGHIKQRNCSPSDYLNRLRLWEKVFSSAPIALGITKIGQIVSVQKYIKGLPPTQQDVDNFLLASGLEPIRQDCFLWKKRYPTFEVWAGDVRDENFVNTILGIVPIDVRIWLGDSN